MFKRASFSAAAALAALVALPATSQAGGCAELDRVGAGVTRVADDVGRGLRRVGDGIVRAGDRTIAMIFHDRSRTR
jgi:hypothetical protein